MGSGLVVGIAIFLVIMVMVERRRFIERKEAMFAGWDSVIESEKGTLAALRWTERELLSCVDGRKLIWMI